MKIYALVSLWGVAEGLSGVSRTIHLSPELMAPGSTHTFCHRTPFLGGNWKCYGDVESVDKLVDALNSSDLNTKNVEVVVAPSMVHLDRTARHLRKDVSIASQTVSTFKTPGAFTGESLASDVKDIGASWSIVGHSERRGMGESNDEVRIKVKNALSKSLNVIVCVGETLSERTKGETEFVLEDQLQVVFDEVEPWNWDRVVIAYEPRWAIGSGQAASVEDIRRAHSFIRHLVRENMGEKIARNVRIVYGGSVNGKNADLLAAINEVDGFLVGKAATDASDFSAISQSLANQRI
eukprot:GDKJ01013163.1.p1 GENE.GDKJ01013163.1~~GDKJ01013163.1.p1  ORF type:complete len:303 (+),score=68.70 GDKJ01013163.1:29-910(+)